MISLKVLCRKLQTFLLKLNYVVLKKNVYRICFKMHGDSFQSKGYFVNSRIDVVKTHGGNKVIIGKNVFARNCSIRINGSNNLVKFGDGCNIGPGCSFWVEGNNVSVIVGARCTFTRDCQLNAQENDSAIVVGDDCMFSNTIVVRTSDSHGIYSLETGKRINNSGSIKIGNHVWIAPKTDVYKGVSVGDGAILGSHSLVTHDVPANTLVVGTPARVVKENVKWTREALF